MLIAARRRERQRGCEGGGLQIISGEGGVMEMVGLS